MEFKKKEFEKLIVQLMPEGFKYKGNFGSARFIKKERDKVITIGIGYYQGFPHFARISGVGVDLYFPQVEDILEQYELGREYSFCESFQQLKDVAYEKLKIQINSEETFTSVKEVVEDIIEKGVMPFLSRFATLEEVANFLADKKMEEIAFYIQGPILFPKTVLIMKLAKHPDFKKRLIEFRDALVEYVLEDKSEQITLNKYNEIFAEDLKALEA